MADIPPDARAALDEVSLIRGRIASAYSLAEYLLGELLVRCIKLPEYASADQSFPWSPGKRPARLRQILSMEGPLSPYRAALEVYAADIESFSRTRHFIAHGHTIVTFNSSGLKRVSFRMYEKLDAETPAGSAAIWEPTLGELRASGDEITAMGGRAYTLMRRVFLELDLEPSDAL